MSRPTSAKLKAKGRFRVGDRARFPHGWTDAVVEIVEDRGPIGAHGRYYYHVRVMRPLIEDVFLDWPDEELIPLAPNEAPGNGTPPTSTP